MCSFQTNFQGGAETWRKSSGESEENVENSRERLKLDIKSKNNINFKAEAGEGAERVASPPGGSVVLGIDSPAVRKNMRKRNRNRPKIASKISNFNSNHSEQFFGRRTKDHFCADQSNFNRDFRFRYI